MERTFVYDGKGRRSSCVVHTVHFVSGKATEGYIRTRKRVVPVRNIQGRWFQCSLDDVSRDTQNAIAYASIG